MTRGSEDDEMVQGLGQSNLHQEKSSQGIELNDVAQATEQVEGEDTIDNDDSHEYPSGARLLIVTVGMMAVVLMVALDNYILG